MPPVGPSSGSTACSGWGINPRTLPSPVGDPRSEHVVGRPTSLAVLHGDRQPLTHGATGCEGRRGRLDGDGHVGADELELAVGAQHAGQEPRLAEDLEPVADAEHGPSLRGEGTNGVHHRSDPGDRAAAEVVAIREPTRENDAPHVARERALGVPDGQRIGTELLECEPGVPVVVRPGEGDDRDAGVLGHASPSTTTS
jgi:hypothetical protein